MTSDRWSDIDRLYHAALEREPADRGAFLDEACAGDADLRQEVESLLRYQPAADGFLERPALQQAAERLAGEVSEPFPDPVIPGYTILKTLGEGGMGVVYLAEHMAPIRRRVAVKLIKHGMDTRRVVARFESERQALALMNHPHIAAVFDAGTSADGRPYFVMEYVDGVPITTYCDQHKLSTRARLELFKDVCAGVQHAHQKGVIHRDIKPSNVLVSDDEGRGTPKIIDFGIAKAIQTSPATQTTVTEQGMLVGTPEYMSPEQAALSPDIDTSTDIYSLGVLLYELLVGSLPFDPKVLRERGPDEMRRVIRESDPPKPSSRLASDRPTTSAVALARQTDSGRLSRQLKGDLDWITLKALEKDRRHRYATASAFSSDIQRFLSDSPVEARPPSAAYRMRKFARRYRTAVAAMAAVFVVLVAGLTVSTSLYIRAEANRVQAAANLKKANELNSQLEDERQKVMAANKDVNSSRSIAEIRLEQADEERKKTGAALRKAEDQRVIAEAAVADATQQKDVAKHEADNANAARKETELTSYANKIGSADGELRSNLAGAARDRLLAMPVELRGWEWQHLFLKADSSVSTLASAAPCARPGEAELPPLASSDNVVVVRSHGARIYLRRCSTLEAWDAPSYTRVTYQADGTILAVGPTGGMLVVHSITQGAQVQWNVQLIDPASRQALGRAGPFDAQPICADISPDGSRVTVGLQPQVGVGDEPLDDTFETWDLQAGRRLAPRMVPPRPQLTDTRNAKSTSCLVAFSPNGTQVATSGATVHVWNTVSGREVLPGRDTTPDPGQAGVVSQPIAWAPPVRPAADSSRLAIGRRNGLVDVLHIGDGRPAEHLDGNGLILVLPQMGDPRFETQSRKRQAVLSLAFTEDGKRILSGADLAVGVWDLEQRKLTYLLAGHAAAVTGVAALPGGRIVSGDASGKVKLWGAGSPGAVTHLPGSFTHAGDLAVSSDGTVAVVAQVDRGLFAWRLDDMRRTVLRAASGNFDRDHLVRALAFSRDANRFLAAEHDDAGTVQPWAIDSGAVTAQAMKLNERPEPGCERLPDEPTVVRWNSVDLMAVSPDGRTLAFRQARCVVVRDLSTQKTVNTLREYPTDLKFLPDGSLVVASYPWVAKPTGGRGRARVRIWDWRTGSVRAEMTPPAASDYEDETWRIATSADGKRIALVGGRPTIVSIRDDGLTRELGRLPVPPDTQRVAWSFDGRRLASTASDITIRIWDADRLQLLLVLIDDDSHEGGLTFTANGRLIAGGSAGGLTIWETQRKAPPGRDR